MIARANPFAVSRVLRVRYQPQGTTWQELLTGLDRLSYRATIVGKEGCGKTTLLEDLASNLRNRFRIKWFSINQESPIYSFGGIKRNDLVFVDGADLLGFLNFRKLLRIKTAGLIITSHRPTSLPQLLQCSTSPELLIEIQKQLIGDYSDTHLSHRLFAKHRGNLRDALRELYDIWAEFPEPKMERRLCGADGSSA